MVSYNTDVIMKKVWLTLMRDAKSASQIAISDTCERYIRTNAIPDFRACIWPDWFHCSTPYQTKWRIQMESFFKRYRFQTDSKDDTCLAREASEKFLADQVRISHSLPLKSVDFIVLQRARRILRDILGEYDEQEHKGLCKFSSNANMGVKYRDSFLDIKLSKLTGTKNQIAWFDKNLAEDDLLSLAGRQCNGASHAIYQQVDTLTLAKVPKSWKAFRTMLPNTVIGSFYSHGVGELLRNRLLDAGLDISSLQQTHKCLAKRFSKSRTHVTADMKSASDSFSRELVRRLLPARWYAVITDGLPRSYVDEGNNLSLQSIMTMGMGHTFPLQTLLFYSLLRAVQQLSGVNGLISVYGDDLIYPHGMHKYVVNIFPRLHLCMNLDKTFVTSYFRESCGGDYCHGIDVRPFNPEGSYQLLTKHHYIAFLHRLYNGLRLRWWDEEIPQTLHMLMSELVNVSDVVYQVPPSFPADAGIHTRTPLKPGIIPWSIVSYARSTQTMAFRYLSWVAKDRLIVTQSPYYWTTLREHSTTDSPCLYASTSQRVRWRNCQKDTVRIQSGRRVPKLEPIECRKGSTQLLCQTGSTSCWP